MRLVFATQVTVNILPQIPGQRLPAVSPFDSHLSRRSNHNTQTSKHGLASVIDSNCQHGYENITHLFSGNHGE